VYVFYDNQTRPVRIGETNDLRRRLKEYKIDVWWLRPPTAESFAYIEIKNEKFRQAVEKILIKLVGEHAIFNTQDKI
jgi:hypothetical protein